jgi:thiazole tautomerase (transcriptional regulator TenI)
VKKELHVISNGKLSFEQLLPIAVKIAKEVDFIHIREREKSARELYEGVKLLIERGISPTKLVINDRIDVALLTDVTRVQLGYRSADAQAVKEKFPALHVGCSVHSLEEALELQEKGADSVMYGHLFPTRSKEGVPPRGLEEVAEIASQLSIPVTAIGGIVPDNIAQVLQTGVTGVAVMSGIVEAGNPFQRVQDYLRLMRRWEKA